MIYTPRNVQQKTSSKGTNYIVADFEDMNGQVTENVSTFDPVKEGVSLDGQIVQNGSYLNFKAQAAVKTGGRQSSIDKAMTRKEEGIARSQDRKEDAEEIKHQNICHTSAIRDATLLTVAMIEAGILGSKLYSASSPQSIGNSATEEMVKTKVRELAVWYRNLYSNPDHLNPSNSSDAPF